MATTPVALNPMRAATLEPLLATPLSTAVDPPSQPLWRFALTGLSPLTLLLAIALLVELSRHFA